MAIENARLYEQVQRLAVVDEQDRISRDLHDSVTQLTIGALYELAAAKSDLDAQSTVAAREKVEMARDLLKQIEREIHQAIYDLRPTLLTGGDLLPGLERYAAGFQELLKRRLVEAGARSPRKHEFHGNTLLISFEL